MEEIKVQAPAQSLKVIFEEKEYLLTKPSLGESRALRKAMKDVEGDADANIEIVLKFLETRGLPIEVAEKLDMDCLEQVVEKLNAKKKS